MLALEKQLDVERDKAIAREWRGRERSILPRPPEINIIVNVLFRAALHFTGGHALAGMEWRRRASHGIDHPKFDARAQPPVPTMVVNFVEWKQMKARAS